MKVGEFADFVAAFLKAPSPYRHLYLWYGEADALQALLPSGKTQSLDLFALAATLESRPLAQSEAQEALSDVLRARVRAWAQRDADARPILVVTGSELLARYRVSLNPFYEALTGQVMVVLVSSARDAAYRPVEPLPSYVICDPGATFTYLSALVEDVIGEY